MEKSRNRYEVAQELHNLLRLICFSRCVYVEGSDEYCIVVKREDRERAVAAVAATEAVIMDWADEIGEQHAQHLV